MMMMRLSSILIPISRIWEKVRPSILLAFILSIILVATVISNLRYGIKRISQLVLCVGETFMRMMIVGPNKVLFLKESCDIRDEIESYVLFHSSPIAMKMMHSRMLIEMGLWCELCACDFVENDEVIKCNLKNRYYHLNCKK